MILKREETPFQYKIPIGDFRFKLEVMQGHINDEPGSFLEDLFSKGSEQKLLFL